MNHPALDHYEIPPPLRKPADDSREMAELVINGIDRNIAWLAERGLRPHPTVIERRAEYLQMAGSGINQAACAPTAPRL